MLIKQCFVLLFTLAATNMAAAACNNASQKPRPIMPLHSTTMAPLPTTKPV